MGGALRNKGGGNGVKGGAYCGRGHRASWFEPRGVVKGGGRGLEWAVPGLKEPQRLWVVGGGVKGSLYHKRTLWAGLMNEGVGRITVGVAKGPQPFSGGVWPWKRAWLPFPQSTQLGVYGDEGWGGGFPDVPPLPSTPM